MAFPQAAGRETAISTGSSRFLKMLIEVRKVIYADVTVLRKAFISCTGHLLKFGVEVRYELLAVNRNAGLFSVAGNLPMVIRQRDQPLAVVPEFVTLRL